VTHSSLVQVYNLISDVLGQLFGLAHGGEVEDVKYDSLDRFLLYTSPVDRPSRKLRCCDRTNSRKFNDSSRIQRDVAILTHHRNFPANLTNHCHLPQLSPFRGYTKGGNSALQTLAEFYAWLHQK